MKATIPTEQFRTSEELQVEQFALRYSGARITKALDAVCKRGERRMDAYCQKNPMMRSSVLGSDFVSSSEYALIHLMKQALMHQERQQRQSNVQRHRLICEVSRRLRLPRAEARKTYADTPVADLKHIVKFGCLPAMGQQSLCFGY